MSIVGTYIGKVGAEAQYTFELKEADGASGKIKGVLHYEKSSAGVEGNHHYYHDQSCTRIWFESSGYKWELRADYVDNKPSFNSWDVKRTSMQNGAVVDMKLTLVGQEGLAGLLSGHMIVGANTSNEFRDESMWSLNGAGEDELGKF